MIAPLLVGIGFWSLGVWFFTKAIKDAAPAALGNVNIKGAMTPSGASVTPSAVDNWVNLVIDGTEYQVGSDYIAPLGIGEAVELAKANGWELPTPRMVDAIWKAADLRLEPRPMAHDGTAKTMASNETIEAHRAKIRSQIDGRDYKLLAGTHKDVVFIPEAFGKPVGKPGIYGWHKQDGTVIQQPMWGHALAWKDYSQGLRPIRKV